MTAAKDPRFWLQCTGLLLLLCCFVAPKLRMNRAVFDVVAVLDITGSMNARDQFLDGARTSRLAVEKRATRQLLAALPCGSRLGVAIFVEERPFLLFAPAETCENFAPLDQAIAAIDWREAWDSESHIAAGLHAAIASARDLGADLVFMTDGQEMPPLAWSTPPDFAALRGSVGGLLVGVGGRDFVEIPKYDKSGREIGVWKPGDVPSETGGFFKGHEYLTAVDEAHLRTLADETGLRYLHLDAARDLLPALQETVRRRVLQVETDMRWILASLALLALLAAETGYARHAARGHPNMPARPPSLN